LRKKDAVTTRNSSRRKSRRLRSGIRKARRPIIVSRMTITVAEETVEEDPEDL
jgi:hypothetical protein